MKKLFLLFTTAALCATSFAQQGSETAIVYSRNGYIPKVDGVVDAMWADVPKNDIATAYTGEEDGFFGPDDFAAYWSAVWNDSGVFVLINVTADDVHYSLYANGADWQTDISEVYFDMNSDNLQDGKGPSAAGSGHYQFAGRSTSDSIIKWGTKSWKYTKVTDPLYVQELFIAWADLADVDGNILTGETAIDITVGFDVMMADNDGIENNGASGIRPRSRMVWCNDGTGLSANEDWNNMDDAGKVDFIKSMCGKKSGLCDVEELNSKKLSIFPNPASDFITISNLKTTNAAIEIYNMQGQRVYLRKNTIGDIDIRNLSKGMYVFKINEKQDITKVLLIKR